MPGLGGPFLVLLGLVAGVAQGGASAAEGQSPAGPNNLQAVDYASLPGGAALVKVVFTQPLKVRPGILIIHYPGNRVAFDFQDTVSAAEKQPIEVGQRGLRSFQVVQSGRRTRLVLYLDRPLAFETEVKGTELLITLRRPLPGAARYAPRWTDGVATDVPRHGLREVEFQRGDSGEGRIVVEVSDATVPIEVSRQGNTLFVDFLGAQVPRQLMRRLDLQDFGTSIRTVDTYPFGNQVRLAVELGGATEFSVVQFDRRLILTPQLEPASR